jgi:CHAD domain-containing protein
MTQFTHMAIKVANEQEFNAVAEKLRGMGYEADADPFFCKWQDDSAQYDPHVLTYLDGEFAFHSHKGNAKRTRYTYEKFMQL